MRKNLNIEVRVPRDRNFLGKIARSTTRWAEADRSPAGYVSAKSALKLGIDSARPGNYRMRTFAEFEGRVNDPRAVQLYGPGIIFFESLSHERGKRPKIVPIHGGAADAFGEIIQADGGLRVTNDYMAGLLAEVKASAEVTLTIIEEDLGFIRRWFRPKVSNAPLPYPVRAPEDVRQADDSTYDDLFWYRLMRDSDRDEDKPVSRGGRDDLGGEKPVEWHSILDPTMGPGPERQADWRTVHDDVMRAKPDAKDPVIIDPFAAAAPESTAEQRETAAETSPSHAADQGPGLGNTETVEMALASPAAETPSPTGTSY
jgi:hypothetical protein